VSTQSVLGFQPKVFNDVGYVNLGNYSTNDAMLQNKNLNAYFNYTKDLGKFKLMQQWVITTNCFKRRYQSGETRQPLNEDIATDPDINLQSYFGRI
jgi:iron complex outermembrane receptor protein